MERAEGRKTVFLTSSHNTPGQSDLNPANGFADAFRAAVPRPCKMLFVASDPDAFGETDGNVGNMCRDFNNGGVALADVRLLDRRTQHEAASLVQWADCVVLMGGHVPTQIRFFHEVHLRELLRPFQGVVLGISAGSMNSAETVYVQPELPGEALDPDFERYTEGLGLVPVMILPHHHTAKERWLDGMRLFEDITFGDSHGNAFWSIPDGSYIYKDDTHLEVRGEAWVIQDGTIRQVNMDGEVLPI